MQTAANISIQTWYMVAEMGPYLLIGFAISAILHRYLNQAWIERAMGRPDLSSIAWGSVAGVPMPLCSCGVIPVTMSLREKGASKGASVSFLTSTPQTGVDAFIATFALLGPVFTVYKLIVAFISGILVGLATEMLSTRVALQSESAAPAPSGSPPKKPRANETLKHAFYTMPGDLAIPLLIGFLLAGLIAALAPADLLADMPGGTLSAILLSTLFSVPFYICSTGSIPLALALTQSGLPTSAALVLLIAGPATNIATIAATRKVLGSRATVVYVSGVILCSWAAAAAYHFFIDSGSLQGHGHSHEAYPALWKQFGGAALLALLILPKIIPLLAKRTEPAQPQRYKMPQHTLSIGGMNCSHCENSVRAGLSELPGISVIAVDRKLQVATVEADLLDAEATRKKLDALGFHLNEVK